MPRRYETFDSRCIALKLDPGRRPRVASIRQRRAVSGIGARPCVGYRAALADRLFMTFLGELPGRSGKRLARSCTAPVTAEPLTSPRRRRQPPPASSLRPLDTRAGRLRFEPRGGGVVSRCNPCTSGVVAHLVRREPVLAPVLALVHLGDDRYLTPSRSSDTTRNSAQCERCPNALALVAHRTQSFKSVEH